MLYGALIFVIIILIIERITNNKEIEKPINDIRWLL